MQDSLENLLELIIDHRGKTPKKLKGSWSPLGFPVISAKNIKNGKIVNSDQIRFVDSELYQRWMPEKLQSGDILLTSEAPLGELFYFKEQKDFCLGQRLFGLRCKKDKIDSRFLYYYLRSNLGQQELQARETGSTVQGIRQSELSKVSVEFPKKIQTQKSISSTLGLFDDKISVNDEISRTLEQIFHAIFKAWFVNYEPFKEGRLIQTELGLIPERWKAGKLGDVATSVRNLVDPSKIDSSTPYIGLEHMPRKSISLWDWDTAGKVKSAKISFKKGEILFGKLRPYFHKVGVSPINGICSSDIIVITPKAKEWSEFVLGIVSSTDFINYTDAVSTGTRMPRVSWEDMARYDVVIPNPEVLHEFSKIAQPIVDGILNNIYQSQTVGSIRDMLLQKLISRYSPINSNDSGDE